MKYTSSLVGLRAKKRGKNWTRTLSYPVLMKVLKPEAQNIEILDDECWSPFDVLANNMANRRAGALRVL